MKSYILKVIVFIKAHLIGAVFLAALVLGVGVASALVGDEAAESANEQLPLVTLATLAELANGSADLPLIGIVESTGEANIQTEQGGTVTSVRYALGDFTPAGAIIATLENRSEQAAVAQAQAALQSAEASYAQTVASISRSTGTTREEAVREYRNAFITASDAVENKTEPFFTNDRTAYPNYLLPTGDSKDFEADRAQISERLRVWERVLERDVDADNIFPHLAQAIDDLRFIEDFLNRLASEANRQMVTGSSFDVTDAERSALAGARTSVTTQLSGLITTRNNLRAVAEGGAGGTGEQEAQIRAAEASVAQARANLDAARASLEQTIVRAPIAGYINALPLKAGQSVGASQFAASVINPDALEVITYIAPSERNRVAIGDMVQLGGHTPGVVTHIAPGVSSRTGKIEMRIAPQSTAELTAGDSIAIALSNAPADLSSQEGSTAPEFFNLPLTAIKFKSDESVIFSVEEGVLVEHVIDVGRVLGNRAQVTTDLPLATRIVVDARGLVVGDEVEVDTNY